MKLNENLRKSSFVYNLAADNKSRYNHRRSEGNDDIQKRRLAINNISSEVKRG